ncbi:DEHA2D00638p [Debaryomyces hansenii CBS767]|uniref:DEHA2D00638p n=1 Tax=Debaryomyces hansenii (strain ATCC 36239 / CBS 767 / BCRC 21394 / JCM 1990 / NBRC 0083 / IGC 2968) TaxID=284592 RepID=Q6BTH3_DEBHA|nr:DEHA2D00638p [Debaryomyces hansenii CBS767]CAG86609.1 DEHA2D00638p [Debaryomyces hansenii CBS767]|eukprot:XP_458496.1 DEHA2D00638p [Debaryomyces hansenii CBS767]
METHDLRIVQVEGIPLVIHDKKIVNSLSERFRKYVHWIAGSSSDDILDHISSHFQNQDRKHA